MSKTPNQTEKTTNAPPVFNYAQAAKRSSQNLENTQKPKSNESKPAAAVTETKVEAPKVEAPSSFAAALAKNAQPASANTAKNTTNTPSKINRNTSVQSPREPTSEAAKPAEVKTEEPVTKEADSAPVADTSSTRRDSTNSGSEPHYHNNRHYNARHNNNQGKQQTPNFVPHHAKKPMSPHMGSASPNQNSGGNWQNNNNQYYRPNQYYTPSAYPMPMPTYGTQAFVPQPAVNKAIRIVNPNTNEVINPQSTTTKDSSTASSPAVTASPKAEDTPKEKEFKVAPSRAIKIVNPREKEEEAERKTKEEAEKKAKEEAEQRAKEEAEKKAKEEAEQKAREEAEKKAREEAEQKAKEEAEKRAKEEAEQRAKEEAEAKLAAEAKAAEEAKIAEEKAKAEQERAKAAEEAKAAKVVEEAKAAKVVEEEQNKAPVEETKPAAAEEERIAAITAEKAARGAAPGRLDMSAIPAHVFHDSPVSTPTATTPKVKAPPMKKIKDFSSIDYPPEFLAPKARDPITGKIAYEAAFLMQFQQLCTETDEDLSAFQGMNEESQGGNDNRRGMSRRQTSERGGRGPRTPGGGNNDGMFRNGSRDGRGGEMGKFAGGRQISHRQGSNGPNSPGMERQDSRGGRNRSGRGGKGRHPPREQVGAPTIPLDQVVPLEKSENRWVPTVVATEGTAATASEAVKGDEALVSQEIIIRKIKSLLNKLTLERFESISNQIWEYAKQSEKEENGQSLRTVIQLVFDKACDEPNFASMWAQLCRKMYDLMSLNTEIKDQNIIDPKTKEPVQGGPLYRKYLLNRCQQEFEKGWKSDLPKIDENAPGEVMMTDEYYAAVKAKRQGLGLVQFIGELFKLQMLTDRVMIECLMKLCTDPQHPEDEETETMCKMLTTMGKTFDTSSKRNKEWLDTYFSRMQEMYQSETLSSRVKFMILDVFDLRKSKWTLKRGNQPAPTTIAQIHEQAKKANEDKEKETMKRSGSSRGGGNPMSRQSSRGGRDISRQNSQHNMNQNKNQADKENSGSNSPAASADGWNTVGTGSPTSTPRSGRTNELANFGKAERSKNRGNVLGPSSSPFSSLSRSGSKAGADKKGSTPTEARSASPATSMSNMFSALGGEGHEEESTGERKKLQLLPRSGTETTASEEAEKPEEEEAVAEEKPKLSDDVIARRSKSTIEEYFSLRDKKELCECIKELDHTDYHVIFASKLLEVVEKKTEDVDVVCEMIAELYKENLMQREEYVLAFKKFWEGYEDLIIDVPQAPKHVDKLLAATGIERSEVECEPQDY